ncbi:cytosine permease [Pandoraea sp. PE-S2R-1]|uniref:purine-cytosine permease family protein n=1 Tax=Pandoraea sp. PE-S2R-1 TaxID=1986994 RepID=UPI0020168D4A|nr:allantoin permease [Pandoraea sp. PE-S2R-1]
MTHSDPAAPATGETDLSTTVVPASARMGPLALTMAWWSLCSAMFLLIVGATLATHFGARNAIIGMSLAAVVSAIVCSILSRYAIRTGFSVALASRVVFGRVGATVATLLFAATNIYYAVFESSVVAIAIKHMWPTLSYGVAALIVVAYSVPLVFGSVQHWLDKLNGVLLPLYLLGLTAAVVMATQAYGYHASWIDFGPAQGVPAYGWWDCFVYYLGCWALMMAAADFARFGRARDMRYHARFNFGLPFWFMTLVVNGVAGIYLVSTIPANGPLSEVSVVFSLLALMGFWGFGFLWVTQTRINTASYFLATLNTHAFFAQALRLSLPRTAWLAVVGLLVYVLMLADVFSHLLQALAYQGVFIVAWVGVMVAYITSNAARGGAEAGQLGRGTRLLDPVGVSAWLLGAVCGVLLMSSEYARFSAPATFLIAAFGYRVAGAFSVRPWPGNPVDASDKTR